MQLNVIVSGFDPVNVIHRHPNDVSPGLDRQPVWRLRMRPQLCQDAGLGFHMNSRCFVSGLFDGVPQRRLEPLAVEGFEQVINRIEPSNALKANWSCAVTNTITGMGWSAMASSRPNPSSSGIWTSRNTRSGESLRIADSAARPSAHSPMISISGFWLQKLAQASAGKGFVIYDQRSDLHG